MMTKHIGGLTALALGLALGGCMDDGGGTFNPGLETVHQPVVQRTDYTIDLQTDGRRSLAAGEAQRLAVWFRSMELGYGDRIAIDESSAASKDATDVIAAQLARNGLRLEDGAPVTTGAIAPGNIRVVVSRTTASVKGCPDWSRPSQPEYEASSMSNYGCAVSSTLAAMVANPEDLVHGQVGEGATDAHTASKAVKSFRDRVPTSVGEIKKETSKGE